MNKYHRVGDLYNQYKAAALATVRSPGDPVLRHRADSALLQYEQARDQLDEDIDHDC